MQTAPLQDSVTQITWKYGGPSPPLAVYHLSSTSWPTSSFPEFCPSVCFSFHFPVRRERSGAELQVVLTLQRSLSTRVKDGWTAGTRRKRWNESKHQNDRWRLWKIKKPTYGHKVSLRISEWSLNLCEWPKQPQDGVCDFNFLLQRSTSNHKTSASACCGSKHTFPDFRTAPSLLWITNLLKFHNLLTPETNGMFIRCTLFMILAMVKT